MSDDINWEQALSKATSRVGWDGEAKRMVAYSKMSTVTILKVRMHKYRK